VPCWLYHHLTLSGPAASVAAFADAARGSGVIPWQIDACRIEADVFNLAVSQPPARRNLSIAGCRILARQFRERVEMRQAQAAALVGCSRACPFDLQRLLPVPEIILALGPTHPAALAGCWRIGAPPTVCARWRSGRRRRDGVCRRVTRRSPGSLSAGRICASRCSRDRPT
jgi:hypothetical protein